MTRLIFDFALSTTWYSGMLQNLDISDIPIQTHNGETFYKMKSAIAGGGASNCEKGGIAADNDKPRTVTVWGRYQLDGIICIFENIN